MKKAMKVVFLALLLCCLFFIASCAEKNDHIHRYAETVVPATCTEQGYTTHICSCGDCYTDSYIPAKGHAFADTLTYDAIGHWYAATCEHTSEKKGYVNHAFADTVIAPTCDKQGYTLHTCTCGYSYKDNIAPATGHKMKNGVCEVCGALEEPRR